MTAVADTPGLGSFSSVDADPGAATLVAALDEQASIPAVQRLRTAATELLGARLGRRIVDVGCETGDVARALAGRVGPSGSVLGIDASQTMPHRSSAAGGHDHPRGRVPPGRDQL
jgi:SAM-dependent methyltransferase